MNDQHKSIYRLLYMHLDKDSWGLTSTLVELVKPLPHSPDEAVNRIVGAIRLAAGEVSVWSSSR